MVYLFVLWSLIQGPLSMAASNDPTKVNLGGPSMHRLIPSAIDLISNMHNVLDVQQKTNAEGVVTSDRKNSTFNTDAYSSTSGVKDFVPSPFLGEITSQPYPFTNNQKLTPAQSSHSHQYVLPSFNPETEQDFHQDLQENDLKNAQQQSDTIPKAAKYSVVEDIDEPHYETYTAKIPYGDASFVSFPHTRYVYDLNTPLKHPVSPPAGVQPTPADTDVNLPKPTAEMYKIPEGMPYRFEHHKPLKFEEDYRATQTEVHGEINSYLSPHHLHFAKEHPNKQKVEWKEYGYGAMNSPVKSMLKFVASLIPLGLFIAALQPTIIQVNASQPDGINKQRSLDKQQIKLPGLEMLEKFGFSSLDDPECEKRLFCQFAVLGSTPEGNASQRGFWQVATRIPVEVLSMFGLADLFKAVRTDTCHIYKCEKNSTLLSSGEKKHPKP